MDHGEAFSLREARLVRVAPGEHVAEQRVVQQPGFEQDLVGNGKLANIVQDRAPAHMEIAAREYGATSRSTSAACGR